MVTEEAVQTRRSSGKIYWAAHLKALEQSGLSRAEYCRRNHLSYHALTYWLRKGQTQSNHEMALVPITLPPPTTKKNVNTSSASLKITLSGGIGVEVGDDFSESALSRLLSVLEGR
jgi:hypothetical protein